MLIKSLAAEWLKMRKSYIWSILAALPAVSILIGTANYYANKSVLTNGWYSLWTQVSLFYGEFFLPFSLPSAVHIYAVSSISTKTGTR